MKRNKPKKQILLPEPENGLNFIDVHCHIPYPLERSTLPSWEIQIKEFIESGGICAITSTIDIETLSIMHKAVKKENNLYYTCGWAPQTVTFTEDSKYIKEKQQWIDFISSNSDFLGIGEIGLDFHHAKTLEKRNKQISELKSIIKETLHFQKPYIFHVRNAGPNDADLNNVNHEFNKPDSANQEILKIIREFNIDPKKCMWHCFSGPQEYGEMLASEGFMLSVPSSAFGQNKWRKNTEYVPLENLVTETDAVFQHPFKFGPINVPKNVIYSIAAIAFSHNLDQKEVAEQTVKNAENFFGKNF